LDTSNSGKPDTCLVYNIKLGAWTKYTNVAANQMTEYEDASGDWHLIYANSYSGQIREIFKNYDDNGIEIPVKIWTKENDFGDPTLYKDIRECDVSGFISESADINITNEIDGEDNATATVEGINFADEVSSTFSVPLGILPLGEVALTGNKLTEGGIDLNPFNVRMNIFQTGYRVQLKIESGTIGSQWVLSKIQYQVKPQSLDYFPTSNYI
jgi:hypothetical protein